jgi:rod shape-determining protein MreD
LFKYFELFGVSPNTALIIIVSFAILRYDIEGAMVGFFSGLLQDIMFGKVIGLYALLGLVIGYFCGKPFKDFYSENYLLPLFLVVGSTLFFEISVYITGFLFRSRLDLFYYLRRIILPSVCYNAFLTIPVYRLIYNINRFLTDRDRSRRNFF